MGLRKVVVAGSRTFQDYGLLCRVLDEKLSPTHEVVILSGGAPGADRLAEQYARERGIRVKRYPAEWQKYGRRAGYLRNRKMAEEADHVIAFWDGKSLGTRMMIRLAKERGIRTDVIFF